MTEICNSAEHQRAVQLFRDATPEPSAPISEWREGFEALCAEFPIAEDTVIEPVSLNGVQALRVVAAGVAEAGDGERAILHFHSGGYVMGSAKGYRNFAERLSAVCGAQVIVPDYRLAPDAPYPAAIEDAVAVYKACLDRYGADRLIVSGDSAGGGLCIATLLAARDQGLALPVAAVAISPLLDLAGEGESTVSLDGIDPLINQEMIVEMGKVYIEDRDPHEHPLASPLWGAHHDLPPIFLTVSASEVLRDDAVRLAESIRRAGGEVQISVPEGLVHIWTLFPFLEQAKQSMDEIGGFVRSRFARS